MPDATITGYYKYTFSDDLNLCAIFAEGPVDFTKSLQIMDRVAKDSRFTQSTDILADIRLVNYHPSSEEYKILSNHLKSLRNNYRKTKIALVCDRKLYNLGHLTSVLAQLVKINMKTFMNIEDAENWLQTKIEN